MHPVYLFLFVSIVFSVHVSCRNLIVQDDIYDISKTKNVNDRPIIGILAQEVSPFIKRKYTGREYNSYIAASYVKFLEGGGARVAPIWIGQPRQYYEDILTKINGVLFPGGSTFFNQTNGYAEAGGHIYDIAMELNSKGNYMPVWGTCLGFELLTYLSANGTEHRSNCNSQRQSLPLEFKEGFKKSRLFGSAPRDVVDILKKEPVTPNFHQFCVTEDTLKKIGLDTEWKVMSLNHDWNNMEFISTVEHFRYPFYGVQFHPEKNIYEFIENKNISHSADAIQYAQYFADFFVKETRKNQNRFNTKEEENNALIYNYSPKFSGRKGSAFQQMYIF